MKTDYELVNQFLSDVQTGKLNVVSMEEDETGLVIKLERVE